jgi:hypothetical protein
MGRQAWGMRAWDGGRRRRGIRADHGAMRGARPEGLAAGVQRCSRRVDGWVIATGNLRFSMEVARDNVLVGGLAIAAKPG